MNSFAESIFFRQELIEATTYKYGEFSKKCQLQKNDAVIDHHGRWL